MERHSSDARLRARGEKMDEKNGAKQDIYAGHPLCGRTINLSELTWEMIKERFGKARITEDCIHALHDGYKCEVLPRERAARHAWYLRVADGYWGGLFAAYRTVSSEMTACASVAIPQKAFAMLCEHLFKYHDFNAGDVGVVNTCIADDELRATLLWFLDPERGNIRATDSILLPHRREQFFSFVRRFCGGVWVAGRGSSKESAVCAAARPQIIKILLAAGMGEELRTFQWGVADLLSLEVLKKIATTTAAAHTSITLRAALASDVVWWREAAMTYVVASAKMAEARKK
jgi:hypothetical protein